jgi:poly-gamma-glutamate synthesis protein (capsule biosynthesis protein)
VLWFAYEVETRDREELHGWVMAAETMDDWVLTSVRTHQGVGGRQTTSETPQFLQEVARDCIETGANVVICHGPHVLRGIELYEGCPIFYSLGNFIVQNETVTRLPAESYRRYGIQDTTKVSEVFSERLFDEAGQTKGDLNDERFWRTVIPSCSFSRSGEVERVELYPCTLQQEESRPQRGIPVLATGEIAQDILDELENLSQTFGTSLRREGDIAMLDA